MNSNEAGGDRAVPACSSAMMMVVAPMMMVPAVVMRPTVIAMMAVVLRLDERSAGQGHDRARRTGRRRLRAHRRENDPEGNTGGDH